VDLTEPLLQLLRDIDFAFDQTSDEPRTPQSEQKRYAAALAVIGRFFWKIAPVHADRFFSLSDALDDLSMGGRPPLLRGPKAKSWPTPTQIAAAKAYVAFALDALIALGESPETAAKRLLSKFPDIKKLAGAKSQRPDYSWERTILEWRKTLSARKRPKNEVAAEIFAAGRDLITHFIQQGRRDELECRALGRAKYSARVGVFVAASNTR
jgi:hypothetical protein